MITIRTQGSKNVMSVIKIYIDEMYFIWSIRFIIAKTEDHGVKLRSAKTDDHCVKLRSETEIYKVSLQLLLLLSVRMNFIICLLTSFFIMKLFWVGICISPINICLSFFQVLEQIIINRTILWEIEKFSNQTWPGRYIWRRKQTISHF